MQRLLGEIFYKDMVLGGDFNTPELDWNNISSQKDAPLHNLLLEIVHDNILMQIVNEATRDLVWILF